MGEETHQRSFFRCAEMAIDKLVERSLNVKAALTRLQYYVCSFGLLMGAPLALSIGSRLGPFGWTLAKCK